MEIGKIKNIIFDWDNTLFPLKKFWTIAHRRVFLDLLEFDAEFSVDQLMEQYNDFDELIWDEVHIGEISTQEARELRVRWTLDYFGIAYKEIFIRNFYDIYLTTLMEEIEPDEWLLSQMKELSQNYRLAILSNGESWEQREKIKQFGFEGLAPVYISEETGVEKPSLDAFINVLQQEQFNPEETLMVGDVISHDIIPAQQLGLLTAYVGNEKNTPADMEFSSLENFFDLILKSESDLKKII